jgi:hypothetical protein
MICKFCQKGFTSLAGLHKHLSAIHNCSQSQYYHSFYPRYDLYSKELIIYKDYKQYHANDFNSRDSFAAWLAENQADPKTLEYCWQKVKERMEKKMVATMPSQVELKSILLPAITGFEKLCGSKDMFLAAARQHNVNLRFDYTAQPTYKEGALKIFYDSREQRPLHFNCPSEKMKLSAGDYTCDTPFFCDVFVERKSLADLAGTLGKGRERFEEEIIRAKELDFYLVIVIEDLYADVLNYAPSNSFARRINGAHICHEIREIMTNYDHIQFVCAGNRQRAADLIEKIFRLGKQVRHLDLEYLRDKRLI